MYISPENHMEGYKPVLCIILRDPFTCKLSQLPHKANYLIHVNAQ